MTTNSTTNVSQAASQTGEPPAKPLIFVTGEHLHQTTARAVVALVRSNKPPVVFLQGSRLARLQYDDGRERPSFAEMDVYEVRYRLDRIAIWVRVTRNGPQPTPPPLEVVRDLLAEPNLPFPRARGVIFAPIFCEDGSIQATAGYDRGSGLYLHLPSGWRLPAVPQHPNASDLARARHLILRELLHDFPFVSDADRAHALALFLLPFVRELIEGPTPLHLVESPAPGTGKGLLADAVLTPALGTPPPKASQPVEEDELRKRLTAQLGTGKPVILLDNLTRSLDSAALAAAITSWPEWEDRLLGKTKVVRLPVRCVWAATGNNVSLSNEMARRAILIRLDSGVERPWLRRGFRHEDLVGWASQHRAELVWAALVFGKAWLAEGRPPGQKVIGTFEKWSQVVGGTLEVAGIGGFLDNIEELYEQADAERHEWAPLVRAWWTKFEGKAVGVADLYALALGHLTLRATSDRGRRTEFGRKLRRMRDRVIDGFRIAHAGEYQGAAQWQLVPVEAGR